MNPYETPTEFDDAHPASLMKPARSMTSAVVDISVAWSIFVIAWILFPPSLFRLVSRNPTWEEWIGLLTLFAAIVTTVYRVLEQVKPDWSKSRFERTWPAISEDEFLAKCKPGTDRQTALKVRRIIAEQLGVPYERIHPDQHFVDDLNCD